MAVLMETMNRCRVDHSH